MPLDANRPAAGAAGGAATPAGDAVRWFAAHELRTPLQGIQGGLALLLEERGAGLSALQLEALSLIGAATADLERCITHLGELAGLAAGPPPRPETLAVGTLVAAAGHAPGLAAGPALLAAAAEDVRVAPALAVRALDHLLELARRMGMTAGLPCELELVEADRLRLALPLSPSPSGEGAVLWHLAAAEMRQAGGLIEPGAGASTRLTLRRASGMPISS